jgi:transposase
MTDIEIESNYKADGDTRTDTGSEGELTRPSPKKQKTAINFQEYQELLQYVKKERGSLVTREEKLDILMIQGRLRYEHHLRHSKSCHKSVKASTTQRVATLLGRRSSFVGAIWSDYLKGAEVTCSTAKGNHSPKKTRIPYAKATINTVQTFVRMRRLTHTRTVARDVMDALCEAGFMTVDRKSQITINSGLRCVQRYLSKLGYKRGEKKGSMSYRLSKENEFKRDDYVAKMTTIVNDQVRRIVYMDESYCHKNYHRHDDILYDPNDEQDLQVKAQHKVKRYCFIAAIIDEDPQQSTVAEKVKHEYSKAHIMLDTLHIFEGGTKNNNGKKNTREPKDYHGMFNSSYFIDWMGKLLEALKVRNVTNAVIVMDNAKYHKSLPLDTPKGSWKKQAMAEACSKYQIPIEANELKSSMWAKLSNNYISKNVEIVVCKMARDAGHEVLFSPPHYSDLQPIELIWAVVKGELGRQYSTDTTFKDVLDRLNKSFNSLKPSTVKGCIRKANTQLKSLMDHIVAIEQAEDDDSCEQVSESTADGSNSSSN